MTQPGPSSELRRTLGVGDAVVVGLGSMIGAGVFAALAPAAARGRLRAADRAGGRRRGRLLQRHVLGAAGRAVPASGGTYVYGRERLGPSGAIWPAGRSSSARRPRCAAMALTVGAYVVARAGSTRWRWRPWWR